MLITIKHVISVDPAALVLLGRIADAVEGATQVEIDKAANAIGDATDALKLSEQNLLKAIAKK